MFVGLKGCLFIVVATRLSRSKSQVKSRCCSGGLLTIQDGYPGGLMTVVN